MARKFANWLKAYINYTRDSESPTSFHFWTGVSVLAGALRRRVWLDMKKFQWTPNFYIILVGPPGIAAKSTSISMGMNLLGKVKGIKFGPESMTWQALAQDLAGAIEYVEFVRPDGTKDRTKMSCLTIQITELGTFLRLDDDQLMSFLIRMWEGQKDTFRHKTKNSGNVEVDNPWLNIIGATTPAWMKENFSESMIGGGLTSRVVFVYGDKKRALIPYPDEVIPPAEYTLTQNDLISDLAEIAKLAGPYQLSTFAREWGRAWYADHNNPDLRPSHLASDRFGGYLARKQTHLHKFAIILAAAKRNTLVIEEDDLKEADAIITDNEKDMLQVFESIGMVDQSRHVTEIVSIVRYSGFMTSKGLWARSMNHMSLKEFEEAVRAAIHGRLLEVDSLQGVQGVRCPSAAKKKGTLSS
jgi:Protein of unknown function (DUF3987)